MSKFSQRLLEIARLDVVETASLQNNGMTQNKQRTYSLRVNRFTKWTLVLFLGTVIVAGSTSFNKILALIKNMF